MSWGVAEHLSIASAAGIVALFIDGAAGLYTGSRVLESALCPVIATDSGPAIKCRAWARPTLVSNVRSMDGKPLTLRPDDHAYCWWQLSATWYFQAPMQRRPNTEVCQRHRKQLVSSMTSYGHT